MNSALAHVTRKPSPTASAWWVTTLAWAATIFALSTEAYSSSVSAWLLWQLLDLLHVTVSPATFHLLHHLARKLAHLSEYAIFAVLIYGSAGGGKDFAWRARRAVLCVAIAAVYSLTDEYHQSFVPSRGPSLVDCTIDTAGASLGILFVFLRDRIVQARLRMTAAAKENPAET